MIHPNNPVFTPLAAALILTSAASLAACQGPSTPHDSYKLTKVESVTDVNSGIRRETKHWQYENGIETKSTRMTFNPQAGRSPRGTKGH